MTPNDVQQELRDQLKGSGAAADQLLERLEAHKQRRDTSIDAATSTMPMRVQRALNARSRASSRSRLAPWAYAMSAAAAVVIFFVQYAPQTPDAGGPVQDTSAAVTRPRAQVIDHDVDVLVDELLRRNTQNRADWTVTDGDVDELLGDQGIDL